MSSDAESVLNELKIGFIGAGNMAYALSKGLVESGLIKPSHVYASAPSDNNLKKIKLLGCNGTHNNKEVASHSTVIFLCVKPHKMIEVIDDIYSHIRDKHLIISVAAGLTLSFLQSLLPKESRIIRVVPNTPSLVQAGASVFTRGSHSSHQDGVLLTKLLSTVSICEEVPEAMIDAMVALCGSGPAFIYMTVQALSDGAVKMGIPRTLANKFAAQVVMGAGKMVLETGKHPEVLKEEVCSPGGTTIYGVHALEEGGLRSAMMNAVQRATDRSKELGKQ